MRPYCLLALILPFTSGRKLEYKIIHGTRSEPKNWMVALRYRKGGGCGGVLYTRSMVISAAHCAKLDPMDWLAHLNRVDLSKEREEGGTAHNVLRYAIHPGYSAKLHYDVSAWWIENNSDERTLVDLDDGTEFKDKNDLLSIAGWGRMKVRSPDEPVGNDPSSSILLEARVPLNDESKCIARYGQDFDPETMICTGYDVSGPSTCQGDSGGPVYRAKGDRIILIGIISHGKGCGYQDYYSKESKVSNSGITKFIKKYAELFTLDNLENVVLDFSERYRDQPGSNDTNLTSVDSSFINEMYPVIVPDPSIESGEIDKYLKESDSSLQSNNTTSASISSDVILGQPKLRVISGNQETPLTSSSPSSSSISETLSANTVSYPSNDPNTIDKTSHLTNSNGENTKPTDSRKSPEIIYKTIVRTVYIPYAVKTPAVHGESYPAYHGTDPSTTINRNSLSHDAVSPYYPNETYGPYLSSSSSKGYNPYYNYPTYDYDHSDWSPLSAYSTHYMGKYAYPNPLYRQNRPHHDDGFNYESPELRRNFQY